MGNLQEKSTFFFIVYLDLSSATETIGQTERWGATEWKPRLDKRAGRKLGVQMLPDDGGEGVEESSCVIADGDPLYDE